MYQVFVVEEELLIRQSIRNVIEHMSGPYTLCGEASDGEMALSMMQDLMPDIVLTDIRMPFGDGFELIRHAKAMTPWLKIVIISGYGDFEFAQKAISLGVDQYMLKMTARLVAKASPELDTKDVAARLSGEHNIMTASGSLTVFRQTAIALLPQAVALREENLSAMKYSHVISRAEKYVAENYPQALRSRRADKAAEARIP